ncbi:hypothetical protein ACX9I7_22235 [Streptomyces sp. L500]|uniref:hypothetical protein n=1 Tax=Streptomyces abikoensis TaxID=97398 RepID=UPI0033F8028B
MTHEPPVSPIEGEGGFISFGGSIPSHVQAQQDTLYRQMAPALKNEAFCLYGHPLINLDELMPLAAGRAFAKWSEGATEREMAVALNEEVMNLVAHRRAFLPDPTTVKLCWENLAELLKPQAIEAEKDKSITWNGRLSIYESLLRVDTLPGQRKAVFHTRVVFGIEGGEAARLLGKNPSTMRTTLFVTRKALRWAGVDVDNLVSEFFPSCMRKDKE